MPIYRFTVDVEECTAGEFLRKRCRVSHRLLSVSKLRPKGLTLQGKQIRTVDLVHLGDEVCLEELDCAAVQESRVPILAETESYVIYDKPQGMPVHPSQGHHGDTLADAFLERYPEGVFRPVYRLDADTFGLCLVAKTAYGAECLSQSTHKTYYALVSGQLLGEGRIEAPIGRVEGSTILREVRADGKWAVTNYKAMEYLEPYTSVELHLETGRTHQIRVHMAYIGHPLAGDSRYGGDCKDYQRHMLCCGELTLTEPESRAIMRYHRQTTFEGENR